MENESNMDELTEDLSKHIKYVQLGKVDIVTIAVKNIQSYRKSSFDDADYRDFV